MVRERLYNIYIIKQEARHVTGGNLTGIRLILCYMKLLLPVVYDYIAS